MRRWGLAIALLAWMLQHPAAAEDESTPQVAADVTAKERDKAIKKAFAYLDDELWKMQAGGSPRKHYAWGVAGWAYLIAEDRGDGKKLPSRKKQIDRIWAELSRYAEEVARLYERDDKKRKKAEKKKRPGGLHPGMPDRMGMRTAQYTWTLSQAAHFFSEAAARGKKKSAAKKELRSIVRVLEASQQEDGGWGHDDASRPGMGLPPIQIPKPGGGSQGYPGTLLAASHCALAGLGQAHRILGNKKSKAADRATAFFAKTQNGDGTFPYDPSQKHGGRGGAMGGDIEVARTGGAVFALHCAGAKPGDPVVEKAIAAIDKNPEAMSEGHGSASMALQYSALACRVRGDAAWKRFRGIFFRRILDHQQEDGNFNCCCKHTSPGVTCDTKKLPGMRMSGYVEQQRVYVTAIYTLILLLDRTTVKNTPPLVPKADAVVTGK